MLTENAGLDDRLTARENLEYTARMRGLTIAEARRRAIGKPNDLAAELWDGVPADIDLGGPVSQAVLEFIASITGVLRTEARATGATIAIRERPTMALVLRALADRDIDVFGATIREASMEDVYFALKSSFAAERA